MAEMFARVHAYLLKIRENPSIDNSEHKTAIECLQNIMAMTKSLSGEGKAELEFYDEMEWRIFASQEFQNRGEFIPIKPPNLYAMKIKPQDVRLLVFPDEELKSRAIADGDLKALLFDKHTPVLTTLDDCAHF